MIRYYKLVGKIAVPAERDEALSAYDGLNANGRIVAKTEVGPLEVSTVFLVIDHRFGEGPPLVFETMIFGLEEDEYQERYSTWDEAEKGHARAVALAREWVAKADAMLTEGKS